MQNDWMLIRGHPDFLILHSAGLSVGRKRTTDTKPEVHGLWTFNFWWRAGRPRRLSNCPTGEDAVAALALMSEVPHPGKDHSQPQPVRSRDDLLIAHRASGLDNRGSPHFGNFLDPVREGEKSIGGGHRTLQRQLRFHGAHLA